MLLKFQNEEDKTAFIELSLLSGLVGLVIGLVETFINQFQFVHALIGLGIGLVFPALVIYVSFFVGVLIGIYKTIFDKR